MAVITRNGKEGLNDGEAPPNTDDGNDSENGDDEPSLDATSDSDVIYDALLAYAAHSRRTVSYAILKSALMQNFSGAQIKKAKALLYDRGSVSGLDLAEARTSSDVSAGLSVKEANVTDILVAFDTFDAEGMIPPIAILASDLGSIPLASPDEVSLMAAADRLSKLEQLVSGLASELATLKASPAPAPNATYASTVAKKKDKPKKKGNDSSTMPGAASHSSSDQSQKASQNDAVTTPQLVNDVPTPGIGDPTFEDPSHVKRRRQRQEKSRRKVITGTASSFNTLTGSEQRRHLFVYNVNPDAKIDDIRDFLKQEGKVEVDELVKISQEEARNQSFRLTVLAKYYDTLNNPAAWPQGVKVRRYVFPPRTRVMEPKATKPTS